MNASQFLLILMARKYIAISVLAVTVLTTIVVTLLLPKSYTAATSLVVDFRGSDPLGNTTTPAQMSSSYMATQVDVLQSHRVALNVVEKLQMDKNPAAIGEFMQATDGRGSIKDWLADLLLEKLKVIPSRDSRIITLEYSTTDPRSARLVANAFAQAYVETTLELSVDPARRSAVWFETQLKTLRTAVEAAQTKLTDYQRKHGIVATDERLDTETAKLNALSQELVAAQAQGEEANSRVVQSQRLMKSGARESETIPEVMNNQFVQSLKAEILRQQAKLDELSRTVGDNHPQYQRAKAEVESLNRKLNTEINNVVQAIENTTRLARSRVVSLADAADAQKKRVLVLKQQREEMNVLMNEVETARRVYDAALQRSNQINLESQFNQTNVNVLTEAMEPTEHSSPKIWLNLVLSIFLGGMLAIASAFLMEFNDRRIRSPANITDELGLPLLGVILRDTAQVSSEHRGLRRVFPKLKLPRLGA